MLRTRSALSGHPESSVRSFVRSPVPLYSAEQRRRRDNSPWTIVQGVLAPIQFAVFLLSTVLAVRFLLTGTGWSAACAASVLKVGALYAIMVTGACWERAVFGVWLFAAPFFWEDLFSFGVIGLHTAYVLALVGGWLPHRALTVLLLVAYAAYAVNATQFVLKLRAARREGGKMRLASAGSMP